MPKTETGAGRVRGCNIRRHGPGVRPGRGSDALLYKEPIELDLTQAELGPTGAPATSASDIRLTPTDLVGLITGTKAASYQESRKRVTCPGPHGSTSSP